MNGFCLECNFVLKNVGLKFDKSCLNTLYLPSKRYYIHTSHSAYVATSTELHGVKIDGVLYPNFM